MNAEAKTSKRTKQILNVLHVLSWIIFIGLCIQTGALLISFFVSLVINPAGARNLHMGLNLSELHASNSSHYVVLVMFIIFLSALKAYIFYLVIKIFLKINLKHPFSPEVASLITKISYLALSIGIITLAVNIYCDWLIENVSSLPTLHRYLGGIGEFLLLGGIIFIIAQVFKRGIEIQSENELTV